MPRSEVAALGRQASTWLVRHVDRFFVRPGGDRGELRRVKRVAELALVVGTLTNRELTGADKLLAYAWSELGCGHHIARLLPAEPIAAASYLPFRLAGLRSLELEYRLAQPSWREHPMHWSHFGRFAIGATLETIGIAAPWDQGAAITGSQLFEPPTENSQVRCAAFLAHAVMWRTEMGRDRQRVVPATIAKYRVRARAWHTLLADAALLDPLGEIAIADACFGIAPAARTLALLATSQRADGALPPHPHATATTFEELYHSTCVAALAGTLAARLTSAKLDTATASAML